MTKLKGVCVKKLKNKLSARGSKQRCFVLRCRQVMQASDLPFTLTSRLSSTTVTPAGHHAHVAAVAVAGGALLTLNTKGQWGWGDVQGGPGGVPSSPAPFSHRVGGRGKGRRWLLRKHRSPAFSCRPCEPPALRDHKEPPHIFTPQGWLVRGA